ncbi:MAG: ABC-F family ATP-binding cassette domain-containing protein [Clostridiales bacterium]|nr:ABC-F family ATP-binding cassette domain-containing protein [Clostridiales bacterium]
MSVISAHSLTMEFLDNVLFDRASFDVEEHDKVGLIGANGVGKTTLFKLIAGIYEPSEGSIFVSSKVKTGIVEQHACSDFTRTAKQEMLSVFENLIIIEKELEALNREIDLHPENADELIEKQSSLTEKFQSEGGLTYRSRAASMLAGLGFSESETNLSVGSLSGGQRTKISLGKLLLSNSDLILLDEPTNHLDIKSVEWLEDFLSKYNGTALIISHDRYFLDKITNKTMEIEHRKISIRKGNYSVYAALKAEQEEADRRKYNQQTKEIERIEGIIKQQRQFNRERNYITIADKQKQIDRIKAELVEINKDEKPLKLSFKAQSNSGNDVIAAQDISKSYSGKYLFKDVSLNVYRGERIFLLGANGCGKSTLLKTIIGKITPDTGLCRFGANVHLGYFDQIQSGLSSSKTVLEELYDTFPAYTISELRGFLGAFKFGGEDINKVMCDLSGGERARIALLELMLKKPNLLILDEPTNHLDIASREVLEDALLDYDGTILCVSHDRFLVNKLATRILILKDGSLTSFDGTYEDYAAAAAMPVKTAQKQEKKPNEYLLRKERESEERKRKTRIKRLEAEIEETELLKTETENELQKSDVISDYKKLSELTEKLNKLAEKQDRLYEEWMQING